MNANNLKCTNIVKRVPLEAFKLPGDGPRKWKRVAERRKYLLAHLSSYANPDGTFARGTKNYSPSEKTLLLEAVASRRSLYRLSDSLKTLGFLSWTRPDHYHMRQYTIHIDKFPSPNQVPNQSSDGKKQVPNQHETGAKSGDPSEKQVPNWTKTGATAGSNIRLYPPFEEPPSPPTKKQLVGWIINFFGQRTGLDEIPDPAIERTVDRLANLFGLDFVRPVIEQFGRRQKGLSGFESIRGLLSVLSREAQEHFEQVKESVENARLAAEYEERQVERAAKRQAEEAAEPVRLAEDKQEAHQPRCGLFFGSECSCQLELAV